jgi:hypothetical protein
MAVPSLGELWRLARLVEGIASLEQRNRESFDEVARRLDAIETRLTNLEAREERMVTEARAAAATAASAAASAHVAELARAVGALKERVRQMGTTALPPPTRRKPRA